MRSQRNDADQPAEVTRWLRAPPRSMMPVPAKISPTKRTYFLIASTTVRNQFEGVAAWLAGTAGQLLGVA